MILKSTVLIAILLTLNIATAQDYRFGKVSKEELQETMYENDSTVDAAVLYREYKIYYNYVQDEGFKKFIEVFERIKIYNKKGFDWGTKTESLYNENNEREEKIFFLKAYTYNLEGGKVVDEKLRKNGIFEEEKNKFWKLFKFTMPDLKEGSIVEYKYTIESPNIDLNEEIFQYKIPVKKLVYQLRVPEYFRINKTYNSKATYVPEITETSKSRKLEVSYHSAMANGGASVKTKFSKDNLIERTYDITEYIYEADLTSIPALKTEAYVDNINNYRAVVKWEIESIKGLDGSVREYSTNWERVVKGIYERENFGGQLEKTNYFEDDIKPIVNGDKKPIEKVALIYNFLKSKVKWDGYRGYTSYKGLKNAYKDGSGNVGDINLMLVAMLRHAGISANPVLLSTRDNGIPLTPTLDGFNYVICRIKLEDNYFLLDATSNYGTANILPERAINWQGRVIDERGYSDWISLKPNMVSDDIIQMSIDIQDNFSVQGKLRQKLTNHLALDFRDNYTKVKPESIITKLEEEKGDIVIENLDVKNKTDLGKPILMSYDFKLENAVEEIGDKLYLSPLLFFGNNTNVFVQDTRVYPIDLIYPQNTKYRININLPDGYEIETTPENAKFVLNTDEGEFSYVIVPNGKTIQVIINSDLNNTLILPKGYPEFKKFVQLSAEKKSEKIVLKKTM
ncbi:transglutaminase domain-containing protein [Lacinutrix chionoecetis]